MEKNLKVNTHHAYLNTEIVITNSGDKVDLVNLSTRDKYELNDILKLHLPAGHHRFSCKELNEEFEIEVEDAIKLGGGDIKNGASFVSDDTPWIFVTMEDRMYGYNLQTNEEFVEYSFTPEKISWLSDDYFLFQTNNEYTILNMQIREVVLQFSNLVYSNSCFVIYDDTDNEEITLYNYQEECFYLSFKGQYSIAQNDDGEDVLFYLKDCYVYSFDLTTGEEQMINKISEGQGTRLIHGTLVGNNNAICLYDKWLIIGTYFIDLLRQESCGAIPLPEKCKVVNVLGQKVENNFEEQANTFRSEACKLIEKYQDISCSLNYVFIDKVCKEDTGINVWFIITVYKIYTKYCKTENRYFRIMLGDRYPQEIGIQEFYSTRYNDSKEQEKFSINSEEGELLAFSSSKERYLTLYGKEIRYHEKGNCLTILKKLFDSAKYQNAFFSSDGNTIILKDNKGNLSSFGLNSFLTDTFSIEGITSFKKNAYNGYKPEILINRTSAIKPVWRDPISLSVIDPNDISDLEYVSPNNLWCAKSQMDTFYYNRLTSKNITNEEYISLCEQYNFKWNSTDNEKTSIIERRKKLYALRKDNIESLLRESNIEKFNGTQLDKHIKTKTERFLNEEQDFVCLFIEHRDYLVYYNKQDQINRRILIGRNVWFLNYVSFSHDSRYVAFGAKMRSDEFRHSEEGVFEIYDLMEDRVVCRMDRNKNLYAVWMTLFSKRGDVAFYDSRPNTYLTKASSNYMELKEIPGKSLLCFSTSGKYIALSEQGYISYEYCPTGSWGHQPSGIVFVYSVDELQCYLKRFNDFGKGLKGATSLSRANSVAAAAFSHDEKRLLAIGEDGVVVVRNLHLPPIPDCNHNIDSSF